MAINIYFFNFQGFSYADTQGLVVDTYKANLLLLKLLLIAILF